MTNDAHLSDTPCAYRDVANHIIASKVDARRNDIEPHFPALTARQVSKALENACNRGLIHSVARGVYRAGPNPTKAAKTKNATTPKRVERSVEAPVRFACPPGVTRNVVVDPAQSFNTNRMIDLALGSLSSIERAWFSVVSSPARLSARMFTA